MANDAINRSIGHTKPLESTQKPSDTHGGVSDGAGNRPVDTSQKQIVEYMEELAGLTGRQMLAILARIGVPITTLALEMSYSEGYISDYAKIRYPLTSLPWRLTTQIRNKVGHLPFDTAYAEIFKGRDNHILRLTGYELRRMLTQRGTSISVLSRQMHMSRNAITSRIAKHFNSVLPIRFVEQVRHAIGETDYEVMLNKVRKGDK